MARRTLISSESRVVGKRIGPDRCLKTPEPFTAFNPGEQVLNSVRGSALSSRNLGRVTGPAPGTRGEEVERETFSGGYSVRVSTPFLCLPSWDKRTPRTSLSGRRPGPRVSCHPLRPPPLCGRQGPRTEQYHLPPDLRRRDPHLNNDRHPRHPPCIGSPYGHLVPHSLTVGVCGR